MWRLFDRRMGKAQKTEKESIMMHYKVILFIQETGLLSAYLVGFESE